MQNQQLPVLIFAQSGRFIAQSATQAGYRVWVADCFGDQDTLAIVERWQALPALSSLTKQQLLTSLLDLTKGEHCQLICGTGIERFFPILNKLPENIHLVGNNSACINTLKTPSLFFNLLTKLNLDHPETINMKPSYNQQDWLVKSASGFGGQHINPIQDQAYSEDHYYQRHIEGKSGSALFIANGKQSQLLSINQQHVTSSKKTPFQLADITTPWQISGHHQKQLISTIAALTSSLSLYGINSLDFIISEQDQLLILEVNPRISASAELLIDDIPLFQSHLNACEGILPEAPRTERPPLSMIYYVYANKPCVIPQHINWPATCHDRPKSGISINKGEPICSLHIQAETVDLLKQHSHRITHDILQQLD